MATTKAELYAEIEAQQKEIIALKRHQQRLIDQREEIAAQLSTLVSQDNAFIHLIEEMLNIKVYSIEIPKYARWEDRKTVWSFCQLPDGEELHQNESLPEGYRHIWDIEQDVRRMRNEDMGIKFAKATKSES
jgi:hypothetical protein